MHAESGFSFFFLNCHPLFFWDTWRPEHCIHSPAYPSTIAMKTFVVLSLLCLAVLAFAADQPSDVIELTSQNFDDVIKEHPVILIEFYAPW